MDNKLSLNCASSSSLEDDNEGIPREASLSLPRSSKEAESKGSDEIDKGKGIRQHLNMWVSPSFLLRCGVIGLAMGGSCWAGDLRVSVLRVEGDDFLKLWRAERADDRAVVETLMRWKEEGRAEVVSEVAWLEEEAADKEVRVGRSIEVPTEHDQDLRRGILTPATMEERWVGSILKVEEERMSLNFYPTDPEKTQWPVTWPSTPDPFVESVEQFDEWEESVKTAAVGAESGPLVVAAFPPADAVFPGAAGRQDGKMDLVVAVPIGREAARDEALLVQGHTMTVYTLSVDSGEAFELLMDRDPARDGELLDSLLERAAGGGVTLRNWMTTAVGSERRAKVVTGRRHQYPTEMPTIPSGWNDRLVGSTLEVDPQIGGDAIIEFEQHLTAPRTAVWQVALDAPEMVMIQPQFVTMRVATALPMGANEVVLISAEQPTKGITGADGLAAGQTLLVFAEASGPENKESAVPLSKNDPFGGPDKEEVEEALEIIAWVVAVPMSEAAFWRRSVGADVERDLAARFAEGTARIETLSMVKAMNGGRLAELSLTEAVLEVTECHRADNNGREGPFNRIRPTSLDRYEIGAQWEVKAAAFADQITVDYQLGHDVAMPIQPTLAEMIDGFYPKQDEVPGIRTFQEEWKGKVVLTSGARRLVEVRVVAHPEGERLHLLWMQARVVENEAE